MKHSGEILIVDDNTADVELMQMVIATYDASVRPMPARDGFEALEILLNARRLPRLVLMDLNLPMLTGIEVLKRLRANSRTQYIPVVIFSGSGKPGDMEEAYRSGANSWVIKPQQFEQLRETVTNILSYWLKLSSVPNDADAK